MTRIALFVFGTLTLFCVFDSSASARGRRCCQPCYPVCPCPVPSVEVGGYGNSNLYYPVTQGAVPGNGKFYSWGELPDELTVGGEKYKFAWNENMPASGVFIVLNGDVDSPAGSSTAPSPPNSSIVGGISKKLADMTLPRYSFYHELKDTTDTFWIRVYFKKTKVSTNTTTYHFDTYGGTGFTK